MGWLNRKEVNVEFNIGDQVWHARIQYMEDYLTCPHCFGNKYLTVILGDDSQVTIDCECCREGWLGPKGKIRVGQYRAEVHLEIINRKEESRNGIEYGLSCFRATSNDIFLNKTEAQARASEMASEHRADEMTRFYAKEKLDRNWAWNAAYHRNHVKRLKQDLAYHESKLMMAQVRAKEKVDAA